MNKVLAVIVAILIPLFVPHATEAAEKDDAISAAKAIRQSLAQGDYDILYDTQTSLFYRQRTPRAQFIQILKQGRAQLGPVQSTKQLSYQVSEDDAATGYKGTIYAVDYLCKYQGGAAFFERVVVVQDTDGKFRLSGIWAQPAPPQ